MKIAKASPQEIDALLNLMRVLNSYDQGFPCKPDGTWDPGEDMQDFDPENYAHLRKFHDRVTACFNDHPGGLTRTIGGYHLAMTNGVFDPAQDTYEWAPDLAPVVAAREDPRVPGPPPTLAQGPQEKASPEDSRSDALKAIGEHLRTQDNRCTADPMFCVQVCERLGPIMPEYNNGEIMFHNHDLMETYYPDRPDPEEWNRLKALDDEGELPDNFTAAGFIEKWITVQVSFTEEGCKQHLEENGHNYRHYHGVRIYAESFHRNPEMLAIRKFLLSQVP